MIKKQMKPMKPMIVTTKHRGVFFGYGDTESKAKTIQLNQAQMCVYWSEAMHGVMGLAAQGPDDQCRIGPVVPTLTLHDVTSIMMVTPKAEDAWKQQPWR